ncbi:hypothetical protein Rs2_14926 [Raphanus sativus]|uniref:Uncharacterized protein LOC130510881 n=1 Tax=Raphanus sativus TaxID=3726 RepID=A0A9W3DIW3_RAPSA|nr:uncharacterized protein LOC130510881 [Raphanus sativus]KAJ4900975.1 hypothetical protein Rs2_14926 [Raphanus sativus]
MEKIDDDYSASTASFSPSFSTYSGDRLSEIAARVCNDDYKEKGNEEFEFAILQTPPSSSPSDGGGLVFPVFDQTLLSEHEAVVVTPLKDLLLRDRNEPSVAYSSSEEEDDLDTIPSEIYCPWTPARSAAEMSPSGGCRKSKSTGSSSTSSSAWSKRGWRIRDLLKRSRSDGKQSLHFLDSSNNRNEPSSSSPKTTANKKEKVSAHEKFYLRNKAIKEEDKKRSYLPYKQDLVGLFSNVSRFSKTFPPF